MEKNRNRDTVDGNSVLWTRTTLAMSLIVAAIAALVITSLLRTHDRAAAQSAAPTPAVAQVAPAEISMSVPLDSGEVGPFAFGYLVFDWDPGAPGGVPGFDSWPPTGKR